MKPSPALQIPFSHFHPCPCSPVFFTLSFLSLTVLCVMVLRTGVFVTRRKRLTSSELLVLPGAGLHRALIPVRSKEVLGESGGRVPVQVWGGMAGARRAWGSLSQLKSLSPPVSVRNGFREWSFENPAKPVWPLMLVSVGLSQLMTLSHVPPFCLRPHLLAPVRTSSFPICLMQSWHVLLAQPLGRGLTLPRYASPLPTPVLPVWKIPEMGSYSWAHLVLSPPSSLLFSSFPSFTL